ncbi:MAG: helix-hairpin-helix domain-containing protein [Bacteroidota bacterium]
MKRIIKDYFTFSKKERTAIVILLLLIACFIAAPYLYSVKRKPPVVNQALVDFLAKNKTAAADSGEENIISFRPPVYESRVSDKETFPFDPNTISPEEWKRLGINDKTIRTITNYRNKGGEFRSAEDIRKIWGLKKEEADRLIPFVRLEVKPRPAKPTGDLPNPQTKQPVTRSTPKEIDINTATLEEWKALPGIGEVLANRIIKFRERIGGFVSMEQLHKTYGISDSAFQMIDSYLKLDPANLPKLNLNTASAFDIRRRLNVSAAISKAIVMYREQYGPYQSINDLKKVVLVSDTLFQRVAVLVSAP